MLKEPAIFRLAADASGPGSARRIIHETGVVPADRLEDVLLAVSELVTNAVKHGNNPGGAIEMHVSRSGNTLRVEVADGGRDFELALDEEPPSGGVGLRLVAQIASRMGSDHKSGTVVWFEIDF